ncbi:hypothetical protein LSAT2_024780 [Lamellibrachia satsuma]|nr:hypothetical protein LSAT2_024780 [Lamellibrachia satsuma]
MSINLVVDRIVKWTKTPALLHDRSGPCSGVVAHVDVIDAGLMQETQSDNHILGLFTHVPIMLTVQTSGGHADDTSTLNFRFLHHVVGQTTGSTQVTLD